MYIVIHIPKTAGTSLACILDHGCGRQIFYDYKQLRSLVTDSIYPDEKLSCDIDDVLNHKEFIADYFKCIYGHFYYKKYVDIFPNAFYMTCVRRPIDRLVSHYHHVLDEKIEDYWLYNELSTGNMGLVDLAKVNGVGNLQSLMLSGTTLDNIDHVFINEKLAESVYQFQLIRNFNRNDPYMNLEGEKSIPKINVMDQRLKPKKNISSRDFVQAESLLIEDNELYCRALEKFSKQSEAAYRGGND